MRMWKVPPETMCRQHLLGEHNEMHMFVGSINKGRSVAGFLRDGIVEVDYIRDRHEELVKEMLRRGYNHKSPLPLLVKVPSENGKVDVSASLRELHRRCEKCQKRYEDYIND